MTVCNPKSAICLIQNSFRCQGVSTTWYYVPCITCPTCIFQYLKGVASHRNKCELKSIRSILHFTSWYSWSADDAIDRIRCIGGVRSKIINSRVYGWYNRLTFRDGSPGTGLSHDSRVSRTRHCWLTYII